MGGKEVILKLKYEKLENFCYACGKMDHVLSECGNPLQYGPWLRAPNEDVDGEKDVAVHVKMEDNEEEQKKKENAEEHLYTVIKVVRDADLAQQIGRNVYFDLVDHDKVRSFRVQKEMPFIRFKDEVAREFGVPAQYQRFWPWAKRKNHTYRPHWPLTHLEENLSVGHLKEVISKKAANPEFLMFLEIELDLDALPVTLPPKTNDDILLFFKLYDPFKEELSYVGRLFVKAQGSPIEILTKLNEMAGYALDEEIDLYEEIGFEPNVRCDRIDLKASFRRRLFEDGDIVCFHKSLPAEIRQQLRYPKMPSFLEYMHHPHIVRFRSLEKPKEDDFSLELSKMYSYDEVVKRVAQRLGLLDPSKIRLTPYNCYSQQPKPQPIKYRGVDTLLDMLVHYNRTSDILYYEVLDKPLPELQGLKILKVAFHYATKHKVEKYIIKLPKQSTVGDVINRLKTRVEMSHPDAELRLLEIFYNKIYKIFPVSEKIDNINDQHWTLRAEEIPEEEKNMGPSDRLIHVYHVTVDNGKHPEICNFGDPFLMVIHDGETLADIKVRIQKKLRVSDKEFAKWRFVLLSLGLRLEHTRLVDADILSSRQLDIYGDWEHYLGMQHTDSAPQSSHAANYLIVLFSLYILFLDLYKIWLS